MNISLLKYLDRTLGRGSIRFIPKPVAGSLNSVTKVLFIRPGGIGDAVYLIPALKAMKALFSAARIDVLAEKRNAGAFDLCPIIGHVFRYDRPTDLLAVCKEKYDVVIDSEQWHFLSAIVARLVRSPVKIGFDTNERCQMFTHAVQYDHDARETLTFLRLVAPLGGARVDFPTAPFLQVSEEISRRTGDLIKGQTRPFVCLFPGASIVERQWGWENFKHLAVLFGKRGLGTVIVGGANDAPQAKLIARTSDTLDLTGQTSLVETAAILQKSRLLVSGDSGVLHIAVGLDVPTVSLFGPGIAKKWAPRGEKHIVLNKNLPCSPCTKFGYTPKCPIGAKCIQDITVEEVFEAVMSLLQKTAD